MANSEDHQNFTYGVGFTFIEERMRIYLLSKVGKLDICIYVCNVSITVKTTDPCEDFQVEFCHSLREVNKMVDSSKGRNR